jgi:hypothetical protein
MKERSMVEDAHAMTFAHKHTNTSIFSAFKHLVYCAQHLPTFLCIPNGRIGVPT